MSEINKIVYGNNTLIDLTEDTVSEQSLANGVTAHNAKGELITGTAEIDDIQPLDPYDVYRDERPSDWLPMPTPNPNEYYALIMIPKDSSISLTISARSTDNVGKIRFEFGRYLNDEFVSFNSLLIGNSSSGITTFAVTPNPSTVSGGFGDQVRIVLDGIYYNNMDLTASGQFVQRVLKVTGMDGAQISDVSIHLGYEHVYEVLFNLPGYPDANINLNSKGTFQDYVNLRFASMICGPHFQTLYNTFYKCYNLLAVLNLSTENVTTCKYVFHNCRNLKAIPSLHLNKLYTSDYLFYNCDSLKAIPDIYCPNLSYAEYMFRNSGIVVAPKLYGSNETGLKLVNCNYMFFGCVKLKKADLSYINGNVKNMNQLFWGCSDLEYVKLCDTSNLVVASSMFHDCNSLKKVESYDGDVLKMGNCISISGMFTNCYNLKNDGIVGIELSSDVNMQQDVSSLFSGCYSLDSIPPLINLKYACGTSNMFSNLNSVSHIGELDLSNSPDLRYTLRYMYSLQSIEKLIIKTNTNPISFADSHGLALLQLDPTVTDWAGCDITMPNECGIRTAYKLIESLPTITSNHTITFPSFIGVMSQANIDLAASKNWTISLT